MPCHAALPKKHSWRGWKSRAGIPAPAGQDPLRSSYRSPHSVILRWAKDITTAAVPFRMKTLMDPGRIPRYSPRGPPRNATRCLSVGDEVPCTGVPAWTWFLRVSSGQITQKPSMDTPPQVRNWYCGLFRASPPVQRRTESTPQKMNVIMPTVRGYCMKKPWYTSRRCQACPVCRFTFAYSIGDSTTARADEPHTADATVAQARPPVPGILASSQPSSLVFVYTASKIANCAERYTELPKSGGMTPRKNPTGPSVVHTRLMTPTMPASWPMKPACACIFAFTVSMGCPTTAFVAP
mmetsp:Transcript_19111/g.52011  ORF Transcript_19111/g.52011 Transcript_19111/m.52011 type:complete len:295 (-) Transcript_19111:118-1002(-)